MDHQAPVSKCLLINNNSSNRCTAKTSIMEVSAQPQSNQNPRVISMALPKKPSFIPSLTNKSVVYLEPRTSTTRENPAMVSPMEPLESMALVVMEALETQWTTLRLDTRHLLFQISGNYTSLIFKFFYSSYKGANSNNSGKAYTHHHI